MAISFEASGTVDDYSEAWQQELLLATARLAGLDAPPPGSTVAVTAASVRIRIVLALPGGTAQYVTVRAELAERLGDVTAASAELGLTALTLPTLERLSETTGGAEDERLVAGVGDATTLIVVAAAGGGSALVLAAALALYYDACVRKRRLHGGASVYGSRARTDPRAGGLRKTDCVRVEMQMASSPPQPLPALPAAK